MDVARHVEELIIRFDQNGFEFALKNWTRTLFGNIEISGVAIG